jgi:hypothetical protein
MHKLTMIVSLFVAACQYEAIFWNADGLYPGS